MAKGKGGSVRSLSDAALAQRMQSILINAADGRRSVGEDAQYSTLRKELVRRKLGTPSFVTTHPSVDSFAAYIKGVGDKIERVRRVRADFEALLQALEGSAPAEIASSAWTGIESPAERLRAVRTLLPLARAAVESLIASLSIPGGNNGPILDEREDALVHLRALHTTLGSLLAAIDSGHFEDQLGQGLFADAARYAKRAAQALKDDPLPYASAGLLLGLFTTLGMPTVGGFLSDVTMNLTKNRDRAR